MKIMVFLQGTVTMHKTGVSASRIERVKQSARKDHSVLDYSTYVPIGNAVEKLNEWTAQGYEIVYVSSNQNKEDVDLDQKVLGKYNFPKGSLVWRQKEKVMFNSSKN